MSYMVVMSTKSTFIKFDNKSGKTFSALNDEYVIREVDLDRVIKNKMVSNPGFKAAWEDSLNECDLIHQIVHIRKEARITQTQLAEKAKCSQQVISRFENRECQSTFSTVCRIVNSLGYELVLKRK